MSKLADELHKILEDFGFSLVDDLKESLVKKEVTGAGGSASELAGSINFKVYGDGLDGGVQFTMNDYWEFVENGRRAGGMPNIDKLMKWIEWKGIPVVFTQKANKKISSFKTRRRKGGSFKKVREGFKQMTREKAIRSMAFAIAKSIEKKGTIKRFQYKGSKFASEVINDGRLKDLEEELLKKLGIQIEIELAEALKPKVKV